MPLPGDEGALVDKHMGLVVREARRFHPDLWEDCTAAGCEGLLQAIRRYDPARGFAFPMLAVPYIRGAIFKWMRFLHGREGTAARRARHYPLADWDAPTPGDVDLSFDTIESVVNVINVECCNPRVGGVARLIAQGANMAQAARQVGISPTLVRHHLESIGRRRPDLRRMILGEGEIRAS